MRKLLLAAALLLPACGGDSNDPGDPEPTVATVLQVQSREFAPPTVVRVTGYVMAVSIDRNRVWIADGLTAVGLEGVEVFNPTPDNVTVGDRIEVVGKIQEFGGAASLTVTQIAGDPEITILTPAAGAPVPVTGLNPATITQDPVPGATLNGELYEGVLVRLTNIEVAEASPYVFSVGPVGFPATEQIIDITDPVGTCYASVTGIWNYDVTTGDWVIVPTVAGLVTGGTCS